RYPIAKCARCPATELATTPAGRGDIHARIFRMTRSERGWSALSSSAHRTFQHTVRMPAPAAAREPAKSAWYNHVWTTSGRLLRMIAENRKSARGENAPESIPSASTAMPASPNGFAPGPAVVSETTADVNRRASIVVASCIKEVSAPPVSSPVMTCRILITPDEHELVASHLVADRTGTLEVETTRSTEFHHLFGFRHLEGI